MRKALFEQLLQSVREMKQIEAGTLKPARVTRAEDLFEDLATVRARLKLSERQFASRIGLSVAKLREIEQSGRNDTPAAKGRRRAAAKRNSSPAGSSN
jgi:DNA-binding transcriptional regulator YiaG